MKNSQFKNEIDVLSSSFHNCPWANILGGSFWKRYFRHFFVIVVNGIVVNGIMANGIVANGIVVNGIVVNDIVGVEFWKAFEWRF